MFFFPIFAQKYIDKAKIMVEINDYRKDLKSRIVNYAMNEFYKRGIKAVKMDEISQGLHVSKRTVYEIFGDKEELLLEGLKENDRKIRVQLEEYAACDNHNVIDIVGYFYKLQMQVSGMVSASFYEEIHRMPRVVEYLHEQHERNHEGRLQFLRLGVDEGLFRPDIDYHLTLELINVAMGEIMHQQLYKEFSMLQIFDNFFLVIIRGLCTERGLSLLNKAIE